MLPLATGLLCLLFIRSPRHLAFDHAVFALHSLSFAVFVLVAMALLDDVIADAASLLLLLVPVHLFVHMRGFYGSSTLVTLTRMTLLGAGTLIGILVLLAGLLTLGHILSA